MSIPNLITLGRILLVPIVVWAIASGAMWIAFVLFLGAGLSDAVDGYLAKRFHMTTELGAYLDPLADKALIVSIYITLGINGLIPGWLVILVVSRDIMIVGAVMLSWLVGTPVKVKPLLVSKLNTAAQPGPEDPRPFQVGKGAKGIDYAIDHLVPGSHPLNRFLNCGQFILIGISKESDCHMNIFRRDPFDSSPAAFLLKNKNNPSQFLLNFSRQR